MMNVKKLETILFFADFVNKKYHLKIKENYIYI
jgi:hypothetical protein